jgi:membrane-associated protein
VVGAFLWAVGLTLLGFFLGQIALVAEYSEIFIIAIVLLSGIPILVELYRGMREARKKRSEPAEAERETDSVLTP